jgi:hypothetical protein
LVTLAGVGDYLYSVSCTSATVCTAVGSATPDNKTSGASVPLAEVWNGNSWAVQPTALPTGGVSSSLTGVSCSTARWCMAVGDQGLLTSQVNGSMPFAELWTGATWVVQQPANPNGNTPAGTGVLLQVSCSSAHACAAVGFYSKGFAEIWNGAHWTIGA